MPIKAILILLLFLTGCASGSVIVTGNKRPPTCPPITFESTDAQRQERERCLETIKLYSQAPKEYEVIGLVESTSGGATQQSRTNNAVKKLKELAAEIGANGVLIISFGDKNAGMVGGAMPIYGGGAVMYAAPAVQPALSGKAIHVTQE